MLFLLENGGVACIPISVTRTPKTCSSSLSIPRLQCQRRHSNYFPKHSSSSFRSKIRAGLEEIALNQVLVSATVAGFGGQLLKPVFPAVMGKGFKWELILHSGGMPSSHSASVVAAATTIGLERGFSDSLFGFAFVIAGIIMYDAQGVRRSVGKQAEVINMMMVSDTANSVGNFDKKISVNDEDEVLESVKMELNLAQASDPPLTTSQTNVDKGKSIRPTRYFPRETELSITGSLGVNSSTQEHQLLEKACINSSIELTNNSENGKAFPRRWKQEAPWRHIPLKESVGHTEAEVLAGGIFGVIVTLGLHWIMKQLQF